MIKHSMKKLFLLSMCLLGLYGSLFPQAPTETAIGSPAAATAATAAAPIAAPGSTPTAAQTATASTVSSDPADRIHRKLEKKLGRKHGIIIDGNDKDKDKDKDEDEDLQKMRDFIAIPIVAIVFLSIFGAPVAIVVMIGIF